MLDISLGSQARSENLLQIRDHIFFARANDFEGGRQLYLIGPVRGMKSSRFSFERDFAFSKHGLDFATAGDQQMIDGNFNRQVKVADLESGRDQAVWILRGNHQDISRK